jgi:hypothetical protein
VPRLDAWAGRDFCFALIAALAREIRTLLAVKPKVIKVSKKSPRRRGR